MRGERYHGATATSLAAHPRTPIGGCAVTRSASLARTAVRSGPPLAPDGPPMRKLHILLFSIAGGLAMGLLWTVAQTGSADTSAHLCEFARHFSSDVPADCHAADWIASTAGWLFIVAVVVALGDIAWIIATWRGWSRRKPIEAEPAPLPSLEIHFDPSNPAQRFWSFESPRDKDGTQLPGIFHEYRVAVFNPTAHTIRNVAVTVEHVGMLPQRPMAQTFDKDRSHSRDIHPGCFELVPVLRWPHPKVQPGMLAGPSALVGYGPLLITASGDDAAPATRTFWFDYGREPMLFDRLEPGEEERARASLTLL